MKVQLFLSVLYTLETARNALCGRVSQAHPPPGTIRVEPGKGTLSAAIKKLTGRSGRQVLLLMPGKYVDTAVLNSYDGGVTIQGFGSSPDTYMNNTVTVISSTKGLTDPASALAIYSNNVEVFGIDFVNDYGSGPNTQAAALTAGGKNQTYGQCSFKSFQDTLYVKKGNHVFYGCYIEGAMDFILGSGRTFFEKCHIGIRKNMAHQVITANGRDDELSDSIFVFNHPTFSEVDKGIAKESTYYGRAWGKKPLVCMQYAGKLDSLNSKGWDLVSAGGSAYVPNGFLEWPVRKGSAGYLATKEYKIADIMNGK